MLADQPAHARCRFDSRKYRERRKPAPPVVEMSRHELDRALSQPMLTSQPSRRRRILASASSWRKAGQVFGLARSGRSPPKARCACRRGRRPETSRLSMSILKSGYFGFTNPAARLSRTLRSGPPSQVKSSTFLGDCAGADAPHEVSATAKTAARMIVGPTKIFLLLLHDDGPSRANSIETIRSHLSIGYSCCPALTPQINNGKTSIMSAFRWFPPRSISRIHCFRKIEPLRDLHDDN